MLDAAQLTETKRADLRRALMELEETAREYKRMSTRYRRRSKLLQQQLAVLREKFGRVGIRLDV